MEIETSIWTGRPTLWIDGVSFEQSSEQGKPFIVPEESGQELKIYTKLSFGELIPKLLINGIVYNIVEKLHWYQYALAFLPMLLVFVGGALGAAIGLNAAFLNLRIFRSGGPTRLMYLKVAGISLLSYAVYLLVTYLITRFVYG